MSIHLVAHKCLQCDTIFHAKADEILDVMQNHMEVAHGVKPEPEPKVVMITDLKVVVEIFCHSCHTMLGEKVYENAIVQPLGCKYCPNCGSAERDIKLLIQEPVDA